MNIEELQKKLEQLFQFNTPWGIHGNEENSDIDEEVSWKYGSNHGK